MMKDEDKSKQQLIEELVALRQQVAELQNKSISAKESNQLAKEALHESEERYRRLLEISFDAITIHRAGKLVAVNASGASLFGAARPEELIGKPVLDFIHPDYLEAVQARMRQTRAEGREVPLIEEKLLRLDGTSLDVEVAAVPITYQGQPAIQAVGRNITRRKRAEEALRESETKFRNLAETTSAAIFIYQGVQFRYVNPAATTITGYTQAELLEMNVLDVVHPDFRELANDWRIARLRGEPVPMQYEIKIITKGGQARWIDLSVGIIEFEGEPSIGGTAFDITERKQAEASLQKSEANLRAIVDNSFQAFVLIGRDRKVQTFNRTAQEIFGQYLQEGHPCCEYLPKEDVAELNEIFDKVLTGESIKVEKKVSLGNLNTWFELDFNPVSVDDGRVVGICFSAINVDERKKAVEALAAREERLLEEMQSVLIITSALVREIELKNLLEFIMTQAEHLTNADGAVVLLLNDDGRQLEVASPGEPWLRIKPGSQISVQESLAGLAVTSQEVQICNNPQADVRTEFIRSLLEPPEIHSLLFAPLIAQNKSLGVLMIWCERPRTFTVHDSRLISLFADQAVLALQNAKLHARNRQLAIEQERNRLARELHDSVTQSLYSIGLVAQTVLRLLGQDADRMVRNPIEYIHTLSEATLAEMREQLYHLHPTVFDEDLVKALAKHCQVLGSQYPIEIEFKPRLESSLSANQRNALFYITREALWNVVRHAKATQVIVGLTDQDDQIVVSIEDNGVGFDPSLRTGGQTLGLRNIEQRAKHLAGTFELQSRPGQGSQLTVRLPLYPPE